MAFTERYVKVPSDAWVNATLYPANSQVVGSDGKNYYCILEHTSETGVKGRPTDGTDYATYWAVADGTTEVRAWTIEEAITDAATPHTGYRYNVKAGSYANMTADYTFSGAGTTTAPIWWRGYKTTIGDKDTAGGSRINDGTEIPLFNGDTSTDQIVVSGAHQIFSNIAVKSVCTDTGGAVNITGGNCRVIRCSIVNTAANSASRALTTGTTNSVTVIGCYLQATTTATSTVNANAITNLYGCSIAGGLLGVGGTGLFTVNYCVIYGFTTTGITCGAASNQIHISNCTVYAAATSCILVSTIPTSGVVIVDNCILGGCTNGVNNNTGGNTNGVTVLRTHFYNVTNELVGLTENADAGIATEGLGLALALITDSTDPFVSKAGSPPNFTLATGNTVDASAGFPGIFDSITGTTIMTGYPDIGAVRHADPAATGGEVSYGFVR